MKEIKILTDNLYIYPFAFDTYKSNDTKISYKLTKLEI
jgi:hypothetical protein